MIKQSFWIFAIFYVVLIAEESFIEEKKVVRKPSRESRQKTYEDIAHAAAHCIDMAADVTIDLSLMQKRSLDCDLKVLNEEYACGDDKAALQSRRDAWQEVEREMSSMRVKVRQMKERVIKLSN